MAVAANLARQARMTCSDGAVQVSNPAIGSRLTDIAATGSGVSETVDEGEGSGVGGSALADPDAFADPDAPADSFAAGDGFAEGDGLADGFTEEDGFTAAAFGAAVAVAAALGTADGLGDAVESDRRAGSTITSG